ncbi:hypothetical protein WG907_00085 [Sphingobium sp. AN558]|uniref:hypothetical protein n=1 Tax=Sphingobium sp. AN558 TaxID=3133442 RepID=UPI0030C60C92
MGNPLTSEIDANYDYFMRNLAKFLVDHKGQYVLLKDRDVVSFFDEPGTAYRFGRSKFVDGVFSIQEVIEEPIDLGFFSHVAN